MRSCFASTTLRVVSTLLIASISPVVSPAQQPTPAQSSSAIRVQTTLITVPAIVTDSHGNRVTNLTKEDFVVRENGQPQTISIFEHVKTGNGPILKVETPDGTFSNTLKQDEPARLTIIVIDAISTGLNERLEMRKQLTGFIARNVSANQPVALLVIFPDGLRVLHDFTTDPKVLVAVLNKVTPSPTIRELRALEREAHNVPPAVPVRMHDNFATGETFESLAGRERRYIEQVLRDFVLWQQKRVVNHTLDGLREIAEAFSGVPGRKSLIWITNGQSIAFGDIDAWAQAGPGAQSRFERTWRALNASNIAVYPLDVSDLTNPAFADPGLAPQRELQAPVAIVSGMEEFAAQTGGQMCYRTQDLDGCFQRASNDSEDYYMLGYYANRNSTKPGWHKLEVFVPTKEVRIRTRNGYYAQNSRPELVQAVSNDLTAAMGSPLEYTNLPVEISLKGGPAASPQPGRKRVSFSFHVPPSGNFIADEGSHINLQFAALAKLPDAKPAGQFVTQAAGNLGPDLVAAINAKGIDMDGAIDLPPGEYQLKFVVRDNQTGRMGSVTARVTVPSIQ